MKQTLQLKLTQHLTLTPQLQQSIRLLQLSTLELNAEVERMLQENPLLEKAEGDDEPRGRRARCAGQPPRRRAEARGDAADERRARGRTIVRGRRATVDNVDRADFEDYSSGESDWGGGADPSDEDDDGFYPQQVAAEHAARPPAAPARRAQPAAARPPDRRRADRRARRGRLPRAPRSRNSPELFPGGARDRAGRALDRAPVPAELRARRASARATRPSASRCS